MVKPAVPAVTLARTAPGVQLVSASDVPHAVIWRAFVVGLAGYAQPVDEMTEADFTAVTDAEGLDRSGSVVALGQDGEPSGVALLMRRGTDAWCGGLGVAPGLRGCGLGHRLTSALLDTARARGCCRIRLEVADGNEGARALYTAHGFVPVRRLETFLGAATAEVGPGSPVIGRFANPETVWGDFAAYHPVAPSWQRELPGLRATTVQHRPEGRCLGDPARPAAYLLVRSCDPDAPFGDAGRPPADPKAALQVVDAGVRPGFGPPTELLATLVGAIAAERPERPIVAGNVPVDDPLTVALRAAGVPVVLGETEMETRL